MKLRELWKLSGIVFKELSFQSIFSLRAGSSLPRSGLTDTKQLVRRAAYNTLISKIMTTIFISVFGFSVFLPLLSDIHASGPPRELTLAGSVSAFLAATLFLIVFMGLQVATSVVSSKIADVLNPLPLSRKDVSNLIFICFVRIFDLPLAAAIVVFLSAYFLVGGSPLGGMFSAVAVIATEAFALALTIGLAKFFFSKVSGGGGGSTWKTLLRLIFMLVWILPTLGTYLVVSFAGNIIQVFGALSQSFSAYQQLLALVYPFSFGFAISYVTSLRETGSLVFVLSSITSLVYVVVAGYALKWVIGMMREIADKRVGSIVRERVKNTFIRPQVPWLGIMRKDLRIASRSPSYASLFLLPAIQTTVLAISFSSLSEAGFSVALGVLTGVSMIALFLPPTMFSIEGLASAYTRSLPLRKKTLIISKTVLATLTYVASLVALLFVALCLGKDSTYVVMYGTIHSLSIAAASMLELVILANKYWKEGFALGNVYARLSTFIVILLPGLAVAWIPIVIAFITYVFARAMVLPFFVATVLIELAVMIFVVLRED